MAKLIVIAAPSGTGKTSLIEALLKDSTDMKFNLSISYTTRKKRINEKDGESYLFIDKKEFERMLENKDFLEHAEVFGNFYGTSKSWVEEQLKEGKNILLELDWQGAVQVKSAYPSAVTIFILPPSYKDLELRLIERDLDKKVVIEKRLAEAKKEIEQGQSFDFLVVNDEFEKALRDLKYIVRQNKELPKERKAIVKSHLQVLLEE
ncbi:MAG TPA: guanylate kinase [Gammaproteobacteria bacterium]|nr:guanylate kinase [Gammaproteobacteria bacterium]